MSKHFGLWCPWCSMWVEKKDTQVEYGDKIHLDCGNVVSRRSSNIPIVYAPISESVKAAQDQEDNAQSIRDFMNDA